MKIEKSLSKKVVARGVSANGWLLLLAVLIAGVYPLKLWVFPLGIFVYLVLRYLAPDQPFALSAHIMSLFLLQGTSIKQSKKL